jgi:plastocyanin
MKHTLMAAAAAGSILLFSGAALGAEPTTTVRLVLKDHRFSPDAVTVAAGQRFRIELVNEDGASEEFDSEDLHVEKDVTPHGKVSFDVGPLKPGRYSFMGELHPDSASGVITAADASTNGN